MMKAKYNYWKNKSIFGRINVPSQNNKFKADNLNLQREFSI